MPNFKVRSYEKELMDTFDPSIEEFEQNLRELECINTLLGGYAVIQKGLNYFFSKFPEKKQWRIADIGSGGGDTLENIARYTKKKSRAIAGIGIDYNPVMVSYAQKKYGSDILHFEEGNVYTTDYSSYDIVTLSLFCHHFTEEELGIIIKRICSQVRIGLIINDLHRHPLAYYSIYFLSRLGGGRLLRNDAPLSVLRGFKQSDWTHFFENNSLSVDILQWRWAFRWLICLSTQSQSHV